MNYIRQLKAQIEARDRELASLYNSMGQLLIHLHSDKFQGRQDDGARKDWIATADVINWLRETRTQALVSGETHPEEQVLSALPITQQTRAIAAASARN